MKQKPAKELLVAKKDDEKTTEYFEFVKASVADGSYFKDSLNWYFFRYVNPFCERTILTFCSIVAAVVFFFLIQMIRGAFPLVEQVPIIITSKDQSKFIPNLINIKPKAVAKGLKYYADTGETVDEAVAKYLLNVYISDREGYNFSKAEITDVNKKYNRIKNTSSAAQYREFQIFMSKDNPESPLNQFGKNTKKIIEIESISFIKKEAKTFSQKAVDFLSNTIPSEAEVRFTAATTEKSDIGKIIKESKIRYLAKVNFSFSGINKDDSKKPLNFLVNDYKLYKVEK